MSNMLSPPTHSAVAVRSLLSVTAEDRTKILEDVEYNIFAFPAGLLTCDFLSDSGTSAMTDVQWAALMRGDESYGRNWGYYCFLDTFRDVFERGLGKKRIFEAVLSGQLSVNYYRDKFLEPYQGGFVNGGCHQLERPNFFITPQGRCAEHLLFSVMSLMHAEGSNDSMRPAIISNGFFDTTGANASVAGFELQAFTQPGLTDKFDPALIGVTNPFKGNIDLDSAASYLESHPGKTVMILSTITNNWAASQPVSMENIRETALLASRYDVPFFFDACRFAENAFFIQKYESGFANTSIEDIVQEMFSYADGFTISLKKDGLANMGGALCFRDRGTFATKFPGIGLRLKEMQIVSYGNDSYGAMSGRDLMTTVTGLYEVTKKSYLSNRIGQVQRLAQDLQRNGISVLLPPGGSAVFLEMNDFFLGCDRNPGDFASVGFTIELIKEYGIRAAEAGPFGWEWDRKSPEERAKIPNLVRFAIPRQVLSDDHINYTVAAVKELYERRHTIPNMIITRGQDMRLRHFSSGLKPVPVKKSIPETYIDAASKQLSCLSDVLGQSGDIKAQLLKALRLGCGDWGRKEIPLQLDSASWCSEVSNDHAPFEYSVALSQATSDAELRFLIEAQPDGNSLVEAQEAAKVMNKAIAHEYSATVSFARMSQLEDLFIPKEPQGLFATWHSFVSSEKGSEWKVYLNPCADGSSNSLDVTQKAFEILGMNDAWVCLQKVIGPSESVLYFSLDLSGKIEDARVKVYVAHPGATASQIAQKHIEICPDACSYGIQQFCYCMAGGSLGPYDSKPLLSCFAFTNRMSDRPVGTIHFPVQAYAKSDAEIEARMEDYVNASRLSFTYQEKYRKIIGAVQRRPLDSGRGIQSWISLKQSQKGASNTFYLSPEIFGPLSLHK